MVENLLSDVCAEEDETDQDPEEGAGSPKDLNRQADLRGHVEEIENTTVCSFHDTKGPRDEGEEEVDDWGQSTEKEGGIDRILWIKDFADGINFNDAEHSTKGV